MFEHLPLLCSLCPHFFHRVCHFQPLHNLAFFYYSCQHTLSEGRYSKAKCQPYEGCLGIDEPLVLGRAPFHLWNDWRSKISAALMNGTQVDCRAYSWSTLTICCLLPFAFVSRAKSPLRLEGSHEQIPQRVTQLADDDIHHSRGSLAAELPRPHLSLWKYLHWQTRPGWESKDLHPLCRWLWCLMRKPWRRFSCCFFQKLGHGPYGLYPTLHMEKYSSKVFSNHDTDPEKISKIPPGWFPTWTSAGPPWLSPVSWASLLESGCTFQLALPCFDTWGGLSCSTVS